MQTKLSQLKALVAANDMWGSLRLANKFGELGNQRNDIQRGWAACTMPDTYESMGYDPVELIELGFAAIKERYNIA